MCKENVYYIVKFQDDDRGKVFYVDASDRTAGFNYTWVTQEEATQFCSLADVEKWLKHITHYHRCSYYGNRSAFTIFKVTETHTPAQPMRREVPLGTAGSKVALKCPGHMTPLYYGASITNDMLQKIEMAKLYDTVVEAINAVRDYSVRCRNGSDNEYEPVGIIEEPAAPTVTRREEPVPPDFVVQDNIKYVRCDKAALYAAEPWA